MDLGGAWGVEAQAVVKVGWGRRQRLGEVCFGGWWCGECQSSQRDQSWVDLTRSCCIASKGQIVTGVYPHQP